MLSENNTTFRLCEHIKSRKDEILAQYVKVTSTGTNLSISLSCGKFTFLIVVTMLRFWFTLILELGQISITLPLLIRGSSHTVGNFQIS